MIKLKEILNHIISDEQEEGLIPVDNWKATDTMYLEDMGFKNDGAYHYALKNPPIRLSYKKQEGFILEDLSKKEKRVFKHFKELEEHFANYKQEWKSQPYL